MEVESAAELQGRRPPSWRRTVAVQAALCLALYAAFSLGEPQLRPRGVGGGGRRGGGVSFLSVAGGARPPADQARLLSHMESTAKVYEVKLVLDVARFGDDPLWQNGSLHFQALNIPWYSTTSHGQIVSNFFKKVEMPYDQILEIVGVDTGPLEELLHDGKISNSSRAQIAWLEQTLALTSNNWKIVVGYDPLLDCNEVRTTKTTKFCEPLRHIFETYAVNAYVSTGGSCGHFHHDNSMSYIQNPIPGDQTNLDGFFLHRVSPLEMETLLINLDGEVVGRSVVHQHGREAMKIVVGYDPLVDCNEVRTTKTTKFYEPRQHIFEKYAVNAYVSAGGSCGHFHHDNSMSYIQNPIPGDQTNLDGFFLHRVSPLEMEILLINLEGEVVQRSVVHQRGRGAM